MKTIFHDKESGIKLEVEGTFANSKAQLVDNEGNVTTELEGSYTEILEMISQLSGNDDKGKEEPQEACEAIVEDKENLTNEDFRGVRVKVLEDITDKYDDTLDKETITTDVNVLHGDHLLINRVIVEPKDFKKLEILTDGQENVQKDELFVVNNDEMEYYLEFEEGEIVKFLYHKEGGFPLMFENSEGIQQAVAFKDVARLENQEGNTKRFDFCSKSNILFTEDTDLEETKVSLTEDSSWIEDDGSLIIDTDCDDGIPYIKSNKSGYGAFISLEKLEKRESDTLQDTPSFKIGEVVEVKEGKDCSGAVGYAILTDIEEREVILQGFNKDGEFFDSWHNNIDNIKKVDK